MKSRFTALSWTYEHIMTVLARSHRANEDLLIAEMVREKMLKKRTLFPPSGPEWTTEAVARRLAKLSTFSARYGMTGEQLKNSLNIQKDGRTLTETEFDLDLSDDNVLSVLIPPAGTHINITMELNKPCSNASKPGSSGSWDSQWTLDHYSRQFLEMTSAKSIPTHLKIPLSSVKQKDTLLYEKVLRRMAGIGPRCGGAVLTAAGSSAPTAKAE